jgi:predicted  nucleic acid-binding Zn-ribbon protein
LSALLRRWWLVVGAVAVASLAAGFVNMSLARSSPLYTTETSLLLTGAKYRQQLDPKFQTVDSLNPAPSAASGSRAEEYRSVALSTEVRRAAAQALGSTLDPSEVLPTGELHPGLVDARVRGQLLSLVATASTPEKATRIADGYAAAVAQRLDAVYGLTEQDQATLEEKLAEAAKRHQEAEARLATFTRENQIDALSLELAAKESATQTLAKERNDLKKTRLAGYYAAEQELEKLKQDAEALRRRIRDAGGSSAARMAHALALTDLESQVVSLASQSSPAILASSGGAGDAVRVEPRVPRNTQFQVNADALVNGGNSREQLIGDLDSLIASIDERRDGVARGLQAAMQELAQPSPPRDSAQANAAASEQLAASVMERLTAEAQAIRSRLQAETFRRDTLKQEVDLARTARTTLETKVQEANILAAAAGGRAVIASSAPLPTVRSFPPPLSRTVPFAAAIGLLVGIVAALGLSLLTDGRDWRGARRLSSADGHEPLREPVSTRAVTSR